MQFKVLYLMLTVWLIKSHVEKNKSFGRINFAPLVTQLWLFLFRSEAKPGIVQWQNDGASQMGFTPSWLCEG